MAYVSNILKFHDKPLSKPIALYQYRLQDEVNWREFKWGIKSLRSVRQNRYIPIVQDYTTLLTSAQLTDDEFESLRYFTKPEKKSLHASNEMDRSILRKLVGECVATSLRNDHEIMWLVEEIANSVYDVSDPVELPDFGSLEVFEGYTYSPIVQESGKIGLIVDLRYKFRSIDTLRILYDRNDYLKYLNEEYTYTPFRDACPVKDCPEKRDPYSLCNLAGTGRSIEVIEIDPDTKPSEYDIEGVSLIEYSRKLNVCPRQPRLANSIADKPPIAYIRYPRSTKIYSFPLERIRVRPSLRYLEEEDRRRIMKLIQPDAPQRFNLTERFARIIERISLPKLPELVSEGFRIPWSDDAFISLNRVQPVIAGGRPARFPHRLLPTYGPADLDIANLAELSLILVWADRPNGKQRQIIRSIFNDEGRSSITTFGQYFKGRSIRIVKEITLQDRKVDDVLDTVKSLSSKNDNVAVLLGWDRRHREKCADLEKKLVLNDIPKQSFVPSLMAVKARKKHESYFRNLYLGLYSKLGGRAWKLPTGNDVSTIYVGYSSRAEHDSIHYAMCAYSVSGDFLEGLHSITTKDTHNEMLAQDLSSLLNQESSRLIFISRGSLYSFEKASLSKFREKYNGRLLAIECVNSPIRVYGRREHKIMPPSIGTGIYISNEEFALVTTPAPSGTSSPILLRKIMGTDNMFRQSVQSILDLTQCYTGYDKVSIKHPVPIHASSGTLGKCARLNMPQFRFSVPWFI